MQRLGLENIFGQESSWPVFDRSFLYAEDFEQLCHLEYVKNNHNSLKWGNARARLGLFLDCCITSHSNLLVRASNGGMPAVALSFPPSSISRRRCFPQKNSREKSDDCEKYIRTASMHTYVSFPTCYFSISVRCDILLPSFLPFHFQQPPKIESSFPSKNGNFFLKIEKTPFRPTLLFPNN